MAAANLINIVVRAIDQSKAAFASAKAGIGSMKTAAGGLSKNLGGLNKGFSAVSGKVSGFGTKLKGLMTSAIGPLIGVMGIAAVTMALKKSVDAFGSFEQAAANASSVTGKTGAAFLETKKHIMDVSKVLGETTVFKASEAADAFYDLASAGYDVANITKTELKPILDLAAASQTDLKATTELVTSTLGQFGMAIGDSKKVADVFARTIGSSKATMEKLGNSMVYVGPVAHALGRSLEETSATLGVLYNKGFDASMAGTALRGALSRLMNPTAQVEAKLSELGVTIAEVNPETHSMADILDTLTSAGMDTADAMELFGLRAGPAMLALTENTDDIRSLTLELENAGGAAAIMAEQQLTTFEGKMKLVQSKLEATTLVLGERFAPMVVNVSNTITDVIIPALGGFFNTISQKINPALDPLKEKLGAAFEKMTGGVSLMQRLKDIGVILGSTLRVLADAFGWVVEKLNPLWELTGKLQSGIGILADLLRTEADYTNDLRAAVELLNTSKANMVILNEKLTIRMSDLAKEIDKSNWGMEKLNQLESDVITAKVAHTAIQSELNAALSRGDIDTYNEKEREIIIATEILGKATAAYNQEIMIAAESQIDYGTATDGVIIAHSQVIKSLNEIEEGLETEEKLTTDVAMATDRAAGKHLILNKAITDAARFLKTSLIKELDHVIYDLERFAGLLGSIAPLIEKGLSFAFPWVDPLKQAIGDVLILEDELVDKTATSMDAVATTVSVGMLAAGQSFELVNQYVQETMDTGTGITEESNKEVIKSWEDRAKEIESQIEIEVNNYQFLTDAEREEVDKRIAILNDELKANQDSINERNEHIKSLGTATKEVTDTTKEFMVTIGDTTLSFKGAAAEVLNNVSAYEELQDSAQKLMDLDWSVFTEFEAALPNIEAGIGDMESAFVGLKDILEDNIGSLENIKESVMDISDIAAPFLEAGFLDGIKSIGSFTGALSDAGSAINTFGNLQDVSVEGCANFSKHVYDMVSALEVLDSQMEDLVPAFGEMDLLITNIADSFLYGGDKMEGFVNSFDSAVSRSKGILDTGAENFEDFRTIVDKAMDAGELTYMAEFIEGEQLVDRWKTIVVEDIEDVRHAMYGWRGNMRTEFTTTVGSITSGTQDITNTYNDAAGALHYWILENYGMKFSYEELYAVMESPPEEQARWFDEMAHSNEAVTFQMDKQTNALKAQTDQLSKITEALQPYLEFMRTLNELAALSTLSTVELNSGLNSINDTLVNLSTSLSTFNLRPVMESLFGTKITEGDLVEFTGGAATGFTKMMTEYTGQFSMLISSVSSLSSAILTLTSSFDALANISKSVLADQTKLKKVFEDIVDIMANFKLAMGAEEGEWGFAQKIADGIGAMLESTKPLITYFQKNNAAVELFNGTLNIFSATMTNVVDSMTLLKEMSEMTLPSVDELEAGFDKAGEAVYWYQQAMRRFSGEGIASLAHNLNSIEKVWESWMTEMGTSLSTFDDTSSGISGLTNSILGLVDAFTSLAEMPIMTAEAFSASMKDMSTNITNFALALKDNIGTIEESLKKVDEAWADNADEMKRLLPIFEDATSAVNTLAGGIMSTVRSFESLKEVKFEEVFATGFKNLTNATGEFATALKNNIDGLLTSLNALVAAWLANEDETARLMIDFIIIASNFILVIGYAKELQRAFSSMATGSILAGAGFKKLTKFMNDVIKGIKEIYTTESASYLAQFIVDIGLVISALSTLEGAIDTVMNTVRTKIDNTVNDAKSKISELANVPSSAYSWGANIIISFADGMHAMEYYIESELIRIAQMIAYYLGVGSNTKLGALSHLTDWPKNLVSTFTEGIRKGTPELSKALSALTLPVESLHIPGSYAGLLGGGHNTVTMYNTWNVDSQQDADYAIGAIETMLTRKKVL